MMDYINNVNIINSDVKIDLQIRSKKLLISSKDSGVGKTYVFEMMKRYLAMNYPELTQYAFNSFNIKALKQDIKGISLNENAILLLDNIELFSKDYEITDCINSAKCQVILFGRENGNILLGKVNIAFLKRENKKLYLEYPFIKE